MATFGRGAARHRQTYYSPWQAFLGTDTRRAQGLEPCVRKRFRETHTHLTSRSNERRSHRVARCRLLDEGLQLAGAAALRRITSYRQRQGFESLLGGRERGSDGGSSHGSEGGNAAG